jgi:hypothetical protein
MARPHNTKKIKDQTILQAKIERPLKEAFEKKVISQGATMSGKLRVIIEKYLEGSNE